MALAPIHSPLSSLGTTSRFSGSVAASHSGITQAKRWAAIAKPKPRLELPTPTASSTRLHSSAPSSPPPSASGAVKPSSPKSPAQRQSARQVSALRLSPFNFWRQKSRVRRKRSAEVSDQLNSIVVILESNRPGARSRNELLRLGAHLFDVTRARARRTTEELALRPLRGVERDEIRIDRRLADFGGVRGQTLADDLTEGHHRPALEALQVLAHGRQHLVRALLLTELGLQRAKQRHAAVGDVFARVWAVVPRVVVPVAEQLLHALIEPQETLSECRVALEHLELEVAIEEQRGRKRPIVAGVPVRLGDGHARRTESLVVVTVELERVFADVREDEA